MTFSLIEQLSRPFDPSQISWRVGSTNKEKTQGLALAYIDSRDVMKRLDDVVGAENWQCDYPFPGCCRLGINTIYNSTTVKISTGDFVQSDIPPKSNWVWKSNGADETDVEGVKGQYSDAFKRAAVLWGIGRYLYSLPAVWCPIEPYGKSYKLSQTPTLPKWALPENYESILAKKKENV